MYLSKYKPILDFIVFDKKYNKFLDKTETSDYVLLINGYLAFDNYDELVIENQERFEIMQYINKKDIFGKKLYLFDIVQDEGGNEAIIMFYKEEMIGSCGCCYEAFDGTGFIAKYLDDFEYDCFVIDLDKLKRVCNIYESKKYKKILIGE